MIDRAATIEKFGYDPDTLSKGSGKRVVAVCDGCGKVRDIVKQHDRDLCPPCAMKKCHGTPKAREKNSAAQKKRFANPIAREKISDAKKKYFKDHPEAGEQHSVKMKKYFKDHPKAGAKISIKMKKRYKNPAIRKEQSDTKKRYYQDHPEAKEKLSAIATEWWSNPEERKRQSDIRKNYFKDPKAREKQSASQKKRYEDPKAHKKASAAQKKYAKDNPISDEIRKKMSATRQGIDYDEWEAFAKDKPYCPAFNEACRENNREKYNRRCFICDLLESKNIDKNGKQKKLSVHHIDLNKNQGCDGHEWKLVPTCIHHHGTAHTPIWIERIKYLLRNVWC